MVNQSRRLSDMVSCVVGNHFAKHDNDNREYTLSSLVCVVSQNSSTLIVMKYRR